MRRIATLPYDEIKFVWINNHYDVHLSGLCKLGNTLFYFKTVNHEDYYEDDTELMCDLFDLTLYEEMKWRMRKFLFEQMVGHHWSYPKRNNKGFYLRKPRWLYRLLFTLYYTIKKL